MTKWIVLATSLLGVAFACSDPAQSDNPCPRGLCTGPGGGGDGGMQGGGDSGGCQAAWTCTPWQKGAGGTYTRTCTDANKCGSDIGKPPEGPLSLPDLDLDFYKCKVEPIVDRNCSMLGCHGTETGRLYKVYARGRLRNSETVPPMCLQSGPQNLADMGTGTTMCEGWLPHTAAEWQSNYDIARSFMVGVTNPDDSDLLAQPRVGGKAHTGVHPLKTTDQDYQTMKAWLGGQKLGTACDPTPN